MPARTTWKEILADRVAPDLSREIDVFETQLELRRQGKIEEKLFAETRLRRGVYGQRYDNGQRHDGHDVRHLALPSGSLTKGPNTLWDAPGMQRIKLPLGRVTPDQLAAMADLAQEYSDGILHVTTRQDIQLHFVHIDDTPDLMRRLAAVGITTREACGNSVRNVTACPRAGTCSGEAFDTTPSALALANFLLGHDDTQDFGRKFKIAFSGCRHEACALVNIHDLGLIAEQREVDGRLVNGFAVFVGGGLGSVPQQAKILCDWIPEAELLPLAQAIARVFARHGERENRARARLKFLVKKQGIDAFRDLVSAERRALRPDSRWTAHLEAPRDEPVRPRRPGLCVSGLDSSEAARRWFNANVRAQKQLGHYLVTVLLPLGDMSAQQARGLVDCARRFTNDDLLLTVDQNLVFRWVSGSDLEALHGALIRLGLGEVGAGSLTDVTACPGTDTCKLGISSSRGLARQLREQLASVADGKESQSLKVKCSGCFNACGQHHVADIGLLGVSRNVSGRRVPHFQLVVGGQTADNAGSYGLAIGAVPSKRVPELVLRLTQRFESEHQEGETFRDFVDRIGKKEIRRMVEAVAEVPSYESDPDYYSDWGDPREYSIADMGTGECAGEVVSSIDMGLAAAEREVFEAQLCLEQGDVIGAGRQAFAAMITAARTLARQFDFDLGTSPDEVVGSFRRHLYDTRAFFDPFAGAKFAHYLFKAHRESRDHAGYEEAHQLIEEAGLFLEAAHQYQSRQAADRQPAPSNFGPVETSL